MPRGSIFSTMFSPYRRRPMRVGRKPFGVPEGMFTFQSVSFAGGWSFAQEMSLQAALPAFDQSTAPTASRT